MERKYYWLKLKEDFFEEDAIQWLEEQKPNGRDYAYFYLKLCLKALKSDGILIRQVGDMLIPYDNKKLAEMTRMDFDTVTVAMELLKKIGLVKVLDGGELYITQLHEMVGYESKWAKYKRQERCITESPESGKLDNVQRSSKNCPNRDRDRDRDRARARSYCTSNIEDYNYHLTNYRECDNITSVSYNKSERDFEKAPNDVEPIGETENVDVEVYNYLEQAFGRTINSYEYQKIENWKWENTELTKFAIDYAVARPAKNVNYVNTLIQDFKDKGIKTVEQAKEDMEHYQKNKGKIQSDEEIEKVYDEFLRGEN